AASSRSALRPAIATRAPSSANRFAIASPNPDPPPVTSMTLPRNASSLNITPSFDPGSCGTALDQLEDQVRRHGGQASRPRAGDGPIGALRILLVYQIQSHRP